MRARLLRERLLQTRLGTAPTFGVREEAFRLARGMASVRTLPPPDEAFVELELERIPATAINLAAHVVLRPADIQGGEPRAYRRGKRVDLV